MKKKETRGRPSNESRGLENKVSYTVSALPSHKKAIDEHHGSLKDFIAKEGARLIKKKK